MILFFITCDNYDLAYKNYSKSPRENPKSNVMCVAIIMTLNGLH